MFIASLVSFDRYKPELISLIKEKTGFDATIDGRLNVALMPMPSFQLHDIALYKNNQKVLSVDTISLSLFVKPLLQGNIQFRELAIHQPVFFLEYDQDGQLICKIDPPASSGNQTTVGKSKGDKVFQVSGQSDSSRFSQLHIDQIRITNGTLHYLRPLREQAFSIHHVNMKGEMDKQKDSLVLQGDFRWKGQTFNVLLSTLLQPLLSTSAMEIPTSLAVNNALFQMHFTGGVSLQPGFKAQGDFKTSMGSLHKFAMWLDPFVTSLPVLDTSLDMKGHIEANNAGVLLSPMTLHSNAMQLSGSVTVNTAFKRPYVKANLDLGALDIGNVLQDAPVKSKTKPVSSLPSSLASQTKKDNAKHSKAFAWLKAFNGDINLRAEQIDIRSLSIGKTHLLGVWNDGKAKLRIQELELYKGKMRGEIHLDAQQGLPQWSGGIALQNMDVQQALSAFTRNNRLTGRMEGDISFIALGERQQDIIRSLNGNARIQLSEGVVQGVALQEELTRLENLFRSVLVNGGQSSQFGKHTSYSVISATADIQNGVIYTQDVKAVTPMLALAGAGSIDLTKQTMSMKVTPSMTQRSQEQVGAGSTLTLVPINISGPFSQLKIMPDVRAVIEEVVQDPEKAIQQFQKNLKALEKLF